MFKNSKLFRRFFFHLIFFLRVTCISFLRYRRTYSGFATGFCSLFFFFLGEGALFFFLFQLPLLRARSKAKLSSKIESRSENDGDSGDLTFILNSYLLSKCYPSGYLQNRYCEGIK